MIRLINIKSVKIKIGELIKLLRKRDHISQEQLAAMLGLSRYTITNLEAGQNATLDTLFKVLQHFDMLETFHEFIDGEIKNHDYESLY